MPIWMWLLRHTGPNITHNDMEHPYSFTAKGGEFSLDPKNQYKLEIPSSQSNGWQSSEGILGWKNKIQEH